MCGSWLHRQQYTDNTLVQNNASDVLVSHLVCRGTVIGILKAFLGLSASAYITIYVSFIEPDAIKFLKILALAPTAVALFASVFINFVPFIQIEPHTKVVAELNRGCRMSCADVLVACLTRHFRAACRMLHAVGRAPAAVIAVVAVVEHEQAGSAANEAVLRAGVRFLHSICRCSALSELFVHVRCLPALSLH